MSEYPQERAQPVLPLHVLGKPATPKTRSPEFPVDTDAVLDLQAMMARAVALADEIAARPNRGDTALPREDLQRFAELGLLMAPLPKAHGGLGLASSAHESAPLLRLLAVVGGADLAIGRLYEGHVNAILLIATFGTAKQLARAAQDCREGKWFGVWNTGRPEVLRLETGPTNGHRSFVFRGGKTFATGAAFVQRPIVTAQDEHGGWQMTVPRMESPEVARAIKIDRSFWHPLGMAASESFAVDFTGAVLTEDDLIGNPGDFYRDPFFYGGSIRFAAVQTGAIQRLHRMFAEWLQASGSGPRSRSQDPYQQARLGEIAIGAQESVLWIERAGAVASECLQLNATKLQIERMHETADMTRLAVERIATAMLPRIISGVGAHGLLQPSAFERVIRDLTMYLRQPIADFTLAAVGKTSLRKAGLRSQGAGSGFWLDYQDDSLPPSYFQRIYERNGDPWGFETSEYEARKYEQTLKALEQRHYHRALEVGCSIGVLTEKLATRTDSLLGVDVSETALDAARKRCASLPQVSFARLRIPQEEPAGTFDLIVVSEVAYYWQRQDLECAIDMLASHQRGLSHLLLVHHTVPVADYPLTGDEVHEAWLARPEWRVIQQERHEGYRLDLLERCP